MRYFVTTSVIFFSLVLSSQDNRFLDSLQSILPSSFEIESVSVSPQEGFYEVKLSDGSLLYVSNDGKSIFYGDLLRITDEGILNLSDESKAKSRLDKIQELDRTTLITFKAKNPLHQIYVFTDVDCGYCRKFHSQIQAYNELGIQVNYLAFPRQGLASEAGQKIISAWCSTEKNKSLTLLKQGEDIEMINCLNNPVESHYTLGRGMGIQGTPAILKADGTIIPGFIEPDRLIKLLN